MLHLQGTEPLQGVHVIADITGRGNGRKDSAGENSIAAEKHPLAGFINTDATGGMTRSMNSPELVITKVNKAMILQPNIGTERSDRDIAIIHHRHKFVLHLYFIRRKSMGGDSRSIEKELCSRDVVEMLVGKNHEVNVPCSESQLLQKYSQTGI